MRQDAALANFYTRIRKRSIATISSVALRRGPAFDGKELTFGGLQSHLELGVPWEQQLGSGRKSAGNGSDDGIGNTTSNRPHRPGKSKEIILRRAIEGGIGPEILASGEAWPVP